MKHRQRQDGWWYPWIFVAAFGVILSVNGTMAFIAVDSWTGLETQNYYQKGKGFNAELAQKAAQDKLGWRPEVVFETVAREDNPRAGFLRVRFTDADGAGVDNLAIDANAIRPVHEGFDQPLVFIARGQGLYIASADLPLPGLWEVRVTANRADQTFKLRQRIQVP